MAGRGKRYSGEFKRKAVAYALSSDRTPYAIGRELGLGRGTLRLWIRNERMASVHQESQPQLTTDEAAELQKPRLENARLRQERDALKRALVIFAGEAA